MYKTGFLLLACLLSSSPALSEEITGLVTHVRDGDTIEVAGVPIRFNGISAPELDTVEGLRGKEFLKTLVLQKQVVCLLNGEISHDRKIGVCYFRGQDLGAKVIRAGHAADCPRYSGGRTPDQVRRHGRPSRSAGSA